ncbi:MAG: hypothetical protein R3A10_12570 [Caldilineaceae bacterium]
MSFAGAQNVATQYPQYADQIMAAAKTAFLAGDDKAYLAGIIAVVIGAALVVLFFPKQAQEQELLQVTRPTKRPRKSLAGMDPRLLQEGQVPSSRRGIYAATDLRQNGSRLAQTHHPFDQSGTFEIHVVGNARHVDGM